MQKTIKSKDQVSASAELSPEPLSKDLLEMELPKIREFIKIMEEHEDKLEKEFKFAEAAKVRAKINQLKNLEEEKAKFELQKAHEDELNQLEQERQESLRAFNEEYDNLLNDLTRKFEDAQAELNQQHSNEFDEAVKQFNLAFPEQNPKLSPEILDLYKKLEGIVKKKEYEKAHEVHMKILELTNAHNQKWNTDTREQKLQAKIQSVKTKQENEFNSLKLKIDSTMNEYYKKRKVENEKLEQSFKNRLKDLTYLQKNQMNELHSAGKTTVIKSDKFMKTNNLKKKTMTSTLGTMVNMNTKISTNLNTEETSKSLDK